MWIMVGLAARSCLRTTGGRAGGLRALLPPDLGALRSERVVGATGVQLLLFAGFVPDVATGGWARDAQPPRTLAERERRIRPTWKPGGQLSYSLGAAGQPRSLFGLAQRSLPPASTVGELCSALEAVGLTEEDVGDDGGVARQMLTWDAPPEPEAGPLLASSRVTLLVLSFDATAECRTLLDCLRPGPTNELLAATAKRFVESRPAQSVSVIAQWEVAAAMAHIGAKSQAVGTPGTFENTAEIYELMGKAAREHAAPAHDKQQLVLLAHPDHLPRALRIGRKVLPTLISNRPPLLPALQPYTLDWPSQTPSAAELNLYAGVTATVQSEGKKVEASWYDARSGYFPDGDPQKWAHSRDVWVLYNHWAMAKAKLTGIIA